MGTSLYPREGVTLFIAGHTPGWGNMEFYCDGRLVEGLKEVDVAEGYAVIYARDAFGNWPALDAKGWPVTLVMQGNWVQRDYDEPEPKRKRNRGKAVCT